MPEDRREFSLNMMMELDAKVEALRNKASGNEHVSSEANFNDTARNQT